PWGCLDLGDNSANRLEVHAPLTDLKDEPDPNAISHYLYSTLIRFSVKDSPNQRLLLEDIYSALADRFPYFKAASPGWKNSIRNSLSLNPCFERVPRSSTDRGQGHYWAVSDGSGSIDAGFRVHRMRTKKLKGTKSAAATVAAPYPTPTYNTITPAPEVPIAGPSTHPRHTYQHARIPRDHAL
ncbi:unnamed protein product, partial [Rhizoctonia solani]